MMGFNKEKLKSGIIAFAGVIFIVYGLLLCRVSNLNLGNICVLGLGIVIFCIGVFMPQMKKFASVKIFKVIRALFLIGLSSELIIVSFLAIYGLADTVDYKEDAVIVLGAGIRGDKVTFPLKTRLDKAVEYHAENPEAVIVVTGGQGFQETVTEAYAMKKYLVQNGVEESKILMEEKATSTAENMRFSKAILDKYFGRKYSVAVITNDFHVFRSVTVAKRNGFQEVSHMHSGLQWFNYMPCFIRESLAVLKLLVIG